MPLLRDLLRRHREQRGINQEELATLVEPPLSPDTISNIALAEKLGVSPPVAEQRQFEHALNATERQLSRVRWAATVSEGARAQIRPGHMDLAEVELRHTALPVISSLEPGHAGQARGRAAT